MSAHDTEPFRVDPELFDPSNQDTLGLPRVEGAETITIYSPSADSAAAFCAKLPFRPQYNHNVRITSRGDGLRAVWQACPKDEDTPDGILVSSTSRDGGRTWSPAEKIGMTVHAQLVERRADPGGEPHPRGTSPSPIPGWSPPEWWLEGQPYVRYEARYFGSGSVYHGPGPRRTEYSVSEDGVHWSPWAFLGDTAGHPIDGHLEPAMRLPCGRLIVWDTRITEADRVISVPYYTDDPAGITGWTRSERKNLPGYHRKGMGREIESSYFFRADGKLVVIFRDMLKEGFMLATMMLDSGERWTPVVQTNMLDQQTNHTAGNLPDGTAFFVNHPTPLEWRKGFGGRTKRAREVLAITLSRDGRYFDRSYLIRGVAELQPQRFEGHSKNTGYSYPNATIIGDQLFVSYGTNKEDVEFTRIPLQSLLSR